MSNKRPRKNLLPSLETWAQEKRRWCVISTATMVYTLSMNPSWTTRIWMISTRT